jgi:hypothetical protein
LNTVYYRVPILNTDRPLGGSDKLVVLLDSSAIVPDQAGLYHEGDRVVEDQFADIQDFFIPIERALVFVLADHCGAKSTGGFASQEGV